MQALFKSLLGFSVCCLLGCSTTRPGSLSITEQDRQVYLEPQRRNETGRSSMVQGPLVQPSSQLMKVAVLVREDSGSIDQSIISALDSTLSSTLSDFAFINLIPRSDLGSLVRDIEFEAFTSENIRELRIPDATHLVTAKVNAMRISQVLLSNRPTVSVDFRFYDTTTGETVLIRNIECHASGIGEQPNQSVLLAKYAEAAQECAKLFGMELGSRFAPPARVLETRGGGKVAKINMGTNYGLAAGMKIEFFVYVDHSDIVEGATLEVSPTGYGSVVESDLKSAWVEITNHQKSQVLRGHYARLSSDQSKGLRDRIIGGMQF